MYSSSRIEFLKDENETNQQKINTFQNNYAIINDYIF